MSVQTEATISERQVRRMARQHGYELRKSRSRNPDYPDYGLFNLFDPATGFVMMRHNDAVRSPFNWPLEPVVEYLRRDAR